MAETTELQRYLEMTPLSRAKWEEACHYLPGGDSRNSIFWKPYPIFITDASGSRVMDADGVQRIDFISTMTTMILGHGPAPVVNAVKRQLDRGIGYNAPNERQVDLARILCERIPSFDLVRFTNSGTEATLNTLRAARAFTGRNRFAKVEGGYHGTHDGVTVSVRVDPLQAGDPSNPLPVPASAGLVPGVTEQVTVIPFNDTGTALRILEENADDLAAIIIEPVMGSVGMVPAQTEYLAMLRDFATENNTALIFDEVISFRIAPGGAQEYYGVTPDLTALGKIIGGGLPVGAFGGRRDIMELYDPTNGPTVSHAGTFNANPLTMLAGTVTMEQLTPDVYRELAEKTELLKEGIKAACTDLEVPVQVTGLGSLFGIHFTESSIENYRDIASANHDLRDRMFLGLLNEGILMASNLVGSVSTAVTPTDIADFLKAFRTALGRNI